MGEPRKQCAKCPWKVSVDPHDIPNGYEESRHRALTSTIRGESHGLDGPFHVMACHEFPVGAEKPCVGWLVNQLGPGNNIALRLRVILKTIDANVQTVGEQHQTLEDSFPQEKSNGT